MKEIIHLYSPNLKLIKYFVDYSFVTELYELTSISTTFCVYPLQTKCNIVIIDLAKNVNVKTLYQDIENAYLNKDIIFVLIDKYGISKDTDFHLVTKIVYDNDNFFDLLNTIYAIHYKRDNKYWMMEDKLLKLMNQLSLKSNLKGYVYLKEAIMLRMEDENASLKMIIDSIARHNFSTSSRVERSIRHIILISYNAQKEDYHRLLTCNNKPSTMLLISKIVYYIKN